MRTALQSSLSPIDKETGDDVSQLNGKVGALPPPPPKGAGEIDALMRRTSEEVAFGQIKAQEGAKKLFAEALSILSRA